MRDFNIHLAFECVKKICESIQCVTCDKLIGPCVRFSCGHSVCKLCAENTGECLYCICPPTDSYLVDDPQTTRFLNVSTLLTTFQDVFKIDEYSKRRISDHLKLEKQVFPECIQAPNKYFNKRTSSILSVKNKENINLSILPGEEITGTDTIKMKKSFQYVQNWLNQHGDVPQNVSRKPFGDININTQLLAYKQKKKLCNMKTPTNPKTSTYRKRSHFKAISNSSLLNDIHNMRDNATVTQTNDKVKKCKSFARYKYDRNESGIVIDDDSIVEENTEVEIIDKDKLAYLAVLEAAKKDECSNYQIEPEDELQNRYPNDNLLIINNKNALAGVESVIKPQNVLYNFEKVLFYKKSSILEMCKQCDQYISYHNTSNCKVKNNDVSIVINSSAFVTTIKFMHCNQRKYDKSNKNSVAIQTDKIDDPFNNTIFDDGKNSSQKKRKRLLTDDIIPAKTIKSDVSVQSLDVFTTNKSNLKSNYCENITKNIWNESAKLSKCVVIEDSDTASNSSNDNSLIHEVVAEVHRTNAPNTNEVQRGILTTLSKSEYQQRSMLPLRGQTRNSSDSSDKENLDPNRRKQPKFGKKHKSKK